MDRFSRILVSVDAVSDTAPLCIERALRLAKRTGAELRVVDVVKDFPALVRQLFHGPTDAEEIVSAERTSRLEKLCQPLADAGIQFSADVLRGRPFVEIITQIGRNQCDLLLRDSPGESLGSLEMRLLRNCPCPLWIVQGDYKPYFRRVLAAVDPLPADEKEQRLNEQILDLASALATWEGANLHLVGIWQIRGEPLLVSKMNEATLLEHVSEIRRAGNEYLAGLVKRLADPIPASRLTYKKGDPAQEIRATAKAIDADVIVMGTVARVGIPGLLMGNTAEAVLRHTRRSVLTIKPGSFRSPVLSATSGD